MKKTKSKEEIYNEICTQMPKELNEIEKAAYIMMKIAKERSFSSKYYWGDKEQRERMYSLCVRTKNKKMENKRKLICVTATKMFNEIAEKFGLETYIIGDHKLTKNNYEEYETGEHLSPVIKTSEGKYIKTDIEWDLENIQTGRRWIKLGTVDTDQENILTQISQDELDQIMIKIGYIQNKEEYLENYLEKIGLENKESSLGERIHTLFNDEVISKKAQELKSSVDIYRFYKRIIKDYIPENERITLFGGYANNENNTRKYTVLAYLEGNEENKENDEIYVWSTRKVQMTYMPKSIMKQFIEKGLITVNATKHLEQYDRMMKKTNDDHNSITCYNSGTVNEMWIDIE